MTREEHEQTLPVSGHQLGNVLQGSVPVLHPVKDKERIDTTKRAMLGGELGHVTLDVHEVVLDFWVGEMLLRVLDHVPGHVACNELPARRTPRQQAVPGEVSRSASDLQELLVVIRFVLERHPQEVQNLQVYPSGKVIVLGIQSWGMCFRVGNLFAAQCHPSARK